MTLKEKALQEKNKKIQELKKKADHNKSLSHTLTGKTTSRTKSTRPHTPIPKRPPSPTSSSSPPKKKLQSSTYLNQHPSLIRTTLSRIKYKNTSSSSKSLIHDTYQVLLETNPYFSSMNNNKLSKNKFISKQSKQYEEEQKKFQQHLKEKTIQERITFEKEQQKRLREEKRKFQLEKNKQREEFLAKIREEKINSMKEKRAKTNIKRNLSTSELPKKKKISMYYAANSMSNMLIHNFPLDLMAIDKEENDKEDAKSLIDEKCELFMKAINDIAEKQKELTPNKDELIKELSNEKEKKKEKSLNETKSKIFLNESYQKIKINRNSDDESDSELEMINESRKNPSSIKPQNFLLIADEITQMLNQK